MWYWQIVNRIIGMTSSAVSVVRDGIMLGYVPRNVAKTSFIFLSGDV